MEVSSGSTQFNFSCESIRYGLMRDYGLKSYGLTRYLDALVVPLSQDLAESVLLLRCGPNGSTGTSHP